MPQISDVELDLEGFTTYLEGDKTRKFSVGHPCACPVAAYLKEKYPTRTIYAYRPFIEWTDYFPAFGPSDYRKSPNPVWAQMFITEVDRNPFASPITASDCLDILTRKGLYRKDQHA